MPTPRNQKSTALDKAAFHERLRAWLDARENVIGDPQVDGRTRWLWVRSGERFAVLHADQKRRGVEEYLRYVSTHGDDIQWAEGLSRRGNPTKVAIGPEKQVLDDLHLYWEMTEDQSPGAGFPYAAYEASLLWKVLDNHLDQLERNGDLRVTTARQYVIGYLCKELDEAGLVRKNTDS